MFDDTYILVNGKPVPEPNMLKFCQWFRSMENRVVEKTDVGPYHVSTVFLGHDDGWDDGPPVLFETMVFGGDKRYSDFCRRYRTFGEAKVGHFEIVDAISGGRPLADEDDE